MFETLLGSHSCQHSSSKKTVTFPFHSARPDGVALVMLAVPFLLCMHVYNL